MLGGGCGTTPAEVAAALWAAETPGGGMGGQPGMAGGGAYGLGGGMPYGGILCVGKDSQTKSEKNKNKI